MYPSYVGGKKSFVNPSCDDSFLPILKEVISFDLCQKTWRFWPFFSMIEWFYNALCACFAVYIWERSRLFFPLLLSF
jgi:hypothetical protein